MDRESEYFFWSGNGSKDSQVRAVARTLDVIFERSGVENALAHRFRHSLASDILATGGSIEDAANVIGDSSATVKKHYAKLTDSYRERIRAVWQRARATELRQFENDSVSALESVVGVVARDGIAQHYTHFRLPVTNFFLNPRMDLAA